MLQNLEFAKLLTFQDKNWNGMNEYFRTVL